MVIDAQLLDAYVAELEALRTHGRDFAEAFPDIAGRLDIGSRRSRDPHVERVIESSAFLAARLRLMIDGTAAELPMTMLSMLAPNLIEPVPSMALAELRGGSEAQLVPRGTRFEHQLGGQVPVFFTSTMSVEVAPLALRLRRLEPTGGAADGLAIQLVGEPPHRLMLCLGNDELSAATLMDGLTDGLAGIEVVPPNGSPVRVPRSRLQMHGFTEDEAALPVRPAVHQAHRLMTEFIAFPEKFRFVSFSGVHLPAGSEIHLRFRTRLSLPPSLPPDLITTNRVPVINLWPTAATPFDISGHKLSYPVQADSLRNRTVECHSVEGVDLHGPEGGPPIRLDPVVAFGQIQDTDIRWGVRRTVSRMGGEVSLYFQGLDFSLIGRQRFLVAPQVLASNRDIAQRAQVRSVLQPTEGLGNWRCTLAGVPSAYNPALNEYRAMEALTGYFQSSLSSLSATNRRRGRLRDFLKLFPGGQNVGWIDAVGRVSFRPVAVQRGGHIQPGMAVLIGLDRNRVRTTSTAVIRRVLKELFESQRMVNHVEEVIVQRSA